MADAKARAQGTIQPVGDKRARSAESARAVPQPAVAAPVPDADFERRRALRQQLEQSYSVHNGVYADPARPTVPLFVAERRKIVAYDTREPTIRAMLDLAQANRWNAIKATGDKEFQRRVWIEAHARGMEVTLHSNRLLQRAYQPSPDDLKIVARLKEARGLGERVERAQAQRPGHTAWEPTGLGPFGIRPGGDAQPKGRRETRREREERYRTAIAAVDAYLATKGVAANVREAIRNLAHLELVDRDAAGRPVRAMVVDPAAPARTSPAPERSREAGREPTIGR